MLVLLVAFVLALTGCGGDNQAVAVPDEAAPLAEQEVAPVEEAVVEEEVAAESEFDLVASVDSRP